MFTKVLLLRGACAAVWDLDRTAREHGSRRRRHRRRTLGAERRAGAKNETRHRGLAAETLAAAGGPIAARRFAFLASAGGRIFCISTDCFSVRDSTI